MIFVNDCQSFQVFDSDAPEYTNKRNLCLYIQNDAVIGVLNQYQESDAGFPFSEAVDLHHDHGHWYLFGKIDRTRKAEINHHYVVRGFAFDGWKSTHSTFEMRSDAQVGRQEADVRVKPGWLGLWIKDYQTDNIKLAYRFRDRNNRLKLRRPIRQAEVILKTKDNHIKKITIEDPSNFLQLEPTVVSNTDYCTECGTPADLKAQGGVWDQILTKEFGVDTVKGLHLNQNRECQPQCLAGFREFSPLA
jgi:hypothetical protein